MKIRKNDNVVVIAGNDRGKTGKVLKVFPKTSRIIIEGIKSEKKAYKTKPKKSTGWNIGKRGLNSCFECNDIRSY